MIGSIPEIVQGWGYLVIFVAGIFAVAWYLPKLAPVYTGRQTTMTPKRTLKRPQLIHDGVLWEDGGNYASGGIMVIGPLCPKDYTPLGEKYRDEFRPRIGDDTFISGLKDDSQLFCLECKAEYTLGKKIKTIKDSMEEVRSRFGGMRRRESN